MTLRRGFHVLFPVSLFLVFPLTAEALLRPEEILSSSLVKHDLGLGKAEICSVPLHFPGGSYSAMDSIQENNLCAHREGIDVAACPKLNSTNPGVDFFFPPHGMSAEELQRRDCSVPGAQKIVKYKLSISCSYSPSLLGYYHVSRLLGDIVNVPPAVLRTMDRERHQQQAERAIRLLRNRKDEVIYRYWVKLKDELDNAEKSRMADLLFTHDLTQSYGAFQVNPRGEEKYAEFNNKSADRENEFKTKNPVYAALTRAGTRFSRDFTPINLQGMRMLKDAADFILLDTVLGQQDRFGNIHYKDVYYYPGSGRPSIRKANSLQEVPLFFRGQAVKVKEMLLRDNDCGVAKDPLIKKAKLLDAVAHMDPKTYRYLQALDREIDSQNMRQLFTRGLHFTMNDYRLLRKNVHEAAKLLRDRCRSGGLALDLDMDAHFSSEQLPDRYSCE